MEFIFQDGHHYLGVFETAPILKVRLELSEKIVDIAIIAFFV